MVENILPVVGYEKIIPAVIVIVSDANPLPPAGVPESSLGGNIGKGAITIIAKKMRDRFTSSRKPLQPPTVHQEDIEPAVVIIVVKCDATAGRL